MDSNPDDLAPVPPTDGTTEPALVVDDRSVALREVRRSYASVVEPTVALDDVSLDVAASGLTVVSGQAGSGKSTLLGIVACLDRCDSGDVWVAGADVNALSRGARRELRRASIGVLRPPTELNVLPGLDAGANLVWAAKRRTRAVLNGSGVEAHLEMVGLGGAARRRVAHLTGGERQRLALACAFSGNPRIVVADEPTATLDADESLRFVNALRDAADRGVAVLVASNDPQLIAVADAVAELSYGRRVA